MTEAQVALVRLFLKSRSGWTLWDRDWWDKDNKHIAACNKCGHVAATSDRCWRLDNLTNTTPHASCIQAAWAEWYAGVQAFLSVCAAEAVAATHQTVSPDSVVSSLTRAIAELRDELTNVRLTLQQRDDALATEQQKSLRLANELAASHERTRLLSGERPAETDEDFTALAHQAIHFAGGPN